MKKTIKDHWSIIFAAAALVLFSIYKVFVLELVWSGVSNNEADTWKETVLPPNAVQVIEAGSQKELLKRSYFLVVPLIIVFISIIIIGKKKSWFAPSKSGFIMGAVTSFLFQGGHELLHGIAFPNGSTVYLGIIKSNFSGYAVSTDPLNYYQCIFYYLLPAFVLGIIPLVFFILDKEKRSGYCWFLYGFALIGLVQTAPDWFGLYPILRQVPHNAVIQISGWHTYWYIR